MKKSEPAKGTKATKAPKPTVQKPKSALKDLDVDPRKAGQVKGGWTKGGGASVG
jgi:hypothetical protein